jgi:hypothetical protein
MKTLFPTFLLVLILSGCATRQPPATFASAEVFSKLLVEELSRFGAVDQSRHGTGRGTHSIAKKFSCELSPDIFSPDQLFEVAKIAVSRWKEYDAFTYGGGQNEFAMDYGSGRTHVFINAVAYLQNGKTRIDVFIGAVQ